VTIQRGGMEELLENGYCGDADPDTYLAQRTTRMPIFCFLGEAE
jgi:hypothetical protein